MYRYFKDLSLLFQIEGLGEEKVSYKKVPDRIKIIKEILLIASER